MAETPAISVVIPVYNGEKFIRDALHGVVAQDYPGLEVIVANDGSTDATAAIVREFAEATLLDLPHHGVSRARNVAVRSSSGNWLAFLDADDCWLPGKLAAQVAALRERPGLDIVFTHHILEVVQPPPAWYRGFADGTSHPGYEPSTWLVRRAFFDAVGGFDESRRVAEDVQWLTRARDFGAREHMEEVVYVRRRIHGGNASGTHANQARTLLGILRESVERKQANSADAR